MGEVTDHVTVLVIGGGPAGSLTAALLARAGVEVLLLEKEVFPRYHIGEALASSCRKVIELAGAAEKVDAFGFLDKHGGLFRWGAEEDWCVDWTETFGEQIRSWSVDRSEFDHLLLDNAADQGARVVQGAAVKHVAFEDDRPVAARWVSRDAPEQSRTCRFDFLVDASGRAGVTMAQHFKRRTRHEVFRNVAIWGYWDGDALLPNTPPGGSNIISAPDGWYWVIPLRNKRRSVGYVTHESTFRKRRRDYASPEDLLIAVVDESDSVRSLLDGNKRMSRARVEQDYSYVSDRFCSPGLFVTGDAACFLDPLLSTGVHLASYSALVAAASIAAVVGGEVTESEALSFYQSLFRRAYTRLFAMVSRMYDQHRGRAGYFWLAQRLIGATEAPARPDAAFVEIISGVTDLFDARHGQQRGVAGLTSADHPADLSDDRLLLVELGAEDLHDAASNLQLVTSPGLGLRRQESCVGEQPLLRPRRPAESVQPGQ